MLKLKLLSPFWIIIVNIALSLCFVSLVFGEEKTKDLSKLSKQAVSYLLTQQKASGLFEYDFDFGHGRSTGKDSLVRQAGTLFSLAEYYSLYPSLKVEQALVRGLNALDLYSTELTDGSKQLVSGGVETVKIRTGATALALLTELLYFRASGNGQFEKARKKWLNGLLSLRIHNKGFSTTPKKAKESPYFSGEAWLALAHYVETFDDLEIQKELEVLDQYFIQEYNKSPHIGFYHWGIMAALIRFYTTQDLKFLDFIKTQTVIFLEKLRPKYNPRSNSCYSLEGLIPAHKILLDKRKDHKTFLLKLQKRIQRELAKVIRLQIKYNSKTKNFYGAFYSNSKRQYTRIDYTQHCLSAFLKTQRE